MVGEELGITPVIWLFIVLVAFAVGIAISYFYFRFKRPEALSPARSIVFENMKDGVMVIDAESQIIDCNPAAQKIFSKQINELKNHNFDEIIKRSIANGILDYQSHASRAELTVSFANGRVHTYYLHITPLHQNHEIPNGKIIVFMDITSRKKAEEAMKQAKEIAEKAHKELETASHAKTVFFGSVSHELRTPLTIITLYSEMIQRTTESRGYNELHTWISQVYKSAKHLSNVVNDILDYSKIEAGMLDLDEMVFDLDDVLEEVKMMAQPLVDQNENQFQIVRHEEIRSIYGDSTRLRQILLNLLSNAAKFTYGGEITIDVYRESRLFEEGIDGLRFEVRDTGIGMNEEQVQDIFKPFKQINENQKNQGTGLGLAVSQRFCHMMGGTISVHSKPEQGSTFIVQIPLKLPASTSSKSV